jgi:hypothetical protein
LEVEEEELEVEGGEEEGTIVGGMRSTKEDEEEVEGSVCSHALPCEFVFLKISSCEGGFWSLKTVAQAEGRDPVVVWSLSSKGIWSGGDTLFLK